MFRKYLPSPPQRSSSLERRQGRGREEAREGREEEREGRGDESDLEGGCREKAVGGEESNYHRQSCII